MADANPAGNTAGPLSVRTRPILSIFQARDIALLAVGREVFDRISIEVDAPLDAQLEGAALLR
jgi:hypothetical protein